MQLKQLELAGGGTLTVYLRDCCERMPNVLDRPLVLVVPGGGYTHVSAREGDPVALQFAAAGYHTAVLDYAICEKAKDYMPLRQLAEAIGLVRQHAAQWHILPEKLPCAAFSGRPPGPFRCCAGHSRRSGPAPAQCSHSGLSGGHGRAVCPPRQFLCSWRAAPTQRHSRCSGWRIRSRRRRRRVRMDHHGGCHRSGGEHPDAGERSAPGGRALRGASV